MKKVLILTLMALLCHFKSEAQSDDLNNYVTINGNKLVLSDTGMFKEENGLNYALHNGEFYLVEMREFNKQGPVSINVYITLKDNSTYSISGAWMEARRKKLQANGSRVMKMREYPDTKPYISYTSPSSGKRFRFYDAKRTPDGRMISEEEFQSYRGNYTYIRRIDGGAFAMDTSIIKPPTEAEIKAVEDQKKRFQAQVGNSAPEFKSIDLFGNEVDSEALKDKVVVVNFWFVACPPCIKEIPQLNKIVSQYEGRDDIVFLGFATDTEKRLGDFLSHTQFKYQIFPKSLSIANDFLVGAYPTNFVIDKKGIVRYAHTGLNEHTIQEVEDTIKKVLEE